MRIRLKQETVVSKDVEIDIVFPYYTKDKDGYYYKFEDENTCLWFRHDDSGYILKKSFYADPNDILKERITKEEFDYQLSKAIKSITKEIIL